MGLFSIFNKAKSQKSKPSVVRHPFNYSGGTLVTPDTSMRVAAFYRGLIYISSQIAKLPWELKDESNRVLNNNTSYLIKTSPNEEISSFSFRLYMTQMAIIYGNAYAEIERDILGRPVALWPIDPTRVLADRTVEGKLYYRVMSGEFTTGEEVILLPKDIFHVKNFHTKDGIVGQGVVAYASTVLGISAGADGFANGLFANGGMPSGVLKTPGSLSDEAYKRIKDDWNKNHSGKKVGGTALLEEGTTYEAISHEPQVMQFLESRKFSVVEIARFLGLPPSKLFDTEVATYANIEQSNLEVATDTLDAWARNYETEADMKLIGRVGRHTEMDLYAVFRGDMETRSSYFTKMMQVGGMTPNEIRKREGMAPYAGGDRYYIATNNYTPSDRMDEVIDSQVKGKEVAKDNANNSPDNKDQDLVNSLSEYFKSRTRE